MKKLLALLLSIMLLMSLVPAATAAGEDPAGEPYDGGEAVELADEGDGFAEPDFPGENEEENSRKAAPGLIWEEVPDNEAQGGRRLVMAGEELPVLAVPAPDGTTANATVSVTVKLPSGFTGTGSEYYRVYLRKATETDNAGKVISSGALYGGKVLDFENANSATAAISVPAGKYSVAVYAGTPIPGLTSGYTYFNADGTVADSQYVAATFSVGSGADSKTVTLPEAERTISGRVTFSEAMTVDDYLSIYTSSRMSPSVNNSSGNMSIFVPKGAKSVDFTVGVARGSWSMEFSMEQWGYYGIYGDLTQEYDDRFSFDVVEDSISGLVIDGDPLLGAVQGEETVRVDIDVLLPEAVSGYVNYRVLILYANEDEDSVYTEISPDVQGGQDSFSLHSFSVPKNRGLVFAYEDMTNVSSYSSASPATRYAAENGITTQYHKAKVYTFAEDGAVTIDDSNNFTVTGTLDRGDFFINTSSSLIAYTFADFADGESYAAHTVFTQGVATGKYTIYVPKSQKGKSFLLTAARTQGMNSNRILEYSRTDPVNYTLSGNMEAETVKLSGEMTTLTGKVSLGAAADKAIAVRIRASCSIEGNNYNTTAYYVIPKGKNSCEYSLDVEQADSVTVYAEIQSNSRKYWPSANANAEMGDGGFAAPDLTLPLAAKISGTVTLPDSVQKNAATVRIYANIQSYSTSYMYLSIFAKDGSAAYELMVPEGSTLSSMYLRIDRDATGELAVDSYDYVGADWSTGNSSSTRITVSGDRDGVDFLVQKGITVSGSFVSEDGAVRMADNVEKLRISMSTSGNSYPMTVNADGTWKFVLPQRDLGTFTYLRLNSSYVSQLFSNVVYTSYYYREGGVALKSGDATSVTVTESGIQGLKFYVQTGWRVSGRVLVPEGGYVNIGSNYYVSLSIDVRNVSTSRSYTTEAQIDSSTGPWTYSVVIPKEEGNYQARYGGSQSYISDDFDTNVVFGARVESAEFSVSGDIASPDVPDITLSLVKSVITGYAVRPEDSTEYIYGYVYVETDSGESYEQYVYLSDNSSDRTYARCAFSIPIPESDTAKTYKIRYSCYSDSMVPNGYLMADDSVSKNESDAYSFSFTEDSTEHSFVFLVKPPFVSGKIFVPDGITQEFSISVSCYSGYSSYGSFWITVDPEKLETENGKKYFPYSVKTSWEEGFDFTIQYNVSYDPNDVLDTSRSYYVKEDGSLTADEFEANSFSYEPGSPVSRDFTLEKGVYLYGTLATENGSDLGLSIDDYTSAGFDTSAGGFSAKLYPDGSWSVCLPQDLIGALDYVSIYVDDDWSENLMPGTYYYAVGAAAVTNYEDASPITVTEAGLTGLKIVVSTVKYTVTGKVSRPTGSSGYLSVDIIVTTFDEDIEIASYTDYFSIGYYSDSETYRVCIPSSDPGTKYTVSYDVSGQKLAQYGWLTETGVGYKQDDAFKFTFGDSNVHDFTLLESLPYLSGRIYLPEGITEAFSINLYAYYSSSVRVDPSAIKTDESGRSYVEYAVYSNTTGSWDSTISYNIYNDPNGKLYTNSRMYLMEDGTFSKSPSGAENFTFSSDDPLTVDLTLVTAFRAGGTVTLPDSVADSMLQDATGSVSVSVTVYLTSASGQSYSTSVYFSLSSNPAERSKDYTILIPSTEGPDYTMRYYTYNEYLEQNGYLTETGVSLNSDEQAAFSFDASGAAVHDIILVVKPVVFKGKIYVPEGMSSPFTIYLSGSALYGKELKVDPASCATDAGGRKYRPYELRCSSTYYTYGSTNNSGTLSYSIREDASDTLIRNDPTSNKYLDENGGISYSSTSIPWTYGETKTVDFEPLTWDVNADRNVIQSVHGFAGEGQTYTYVYEYPGECESLTLHFVYGDYTVYINDSSCSTYYQRNYDYTVPGNTVTIKLVAPSNSASSTTRYYGFAIDKVTANGVTEPVTGVASVFTENGTAPAVMLKDVWEGGTLTAVFVGDSETPVKRTALVALYSADGKFLSVSEQEVEISSTSGTAAHFRFSTAEQAAKAKIMLVDETTFEPVIQEIVIEEQPILN